MEQVGAARCLLVCLVSLFCLINPTVESDSVKERFKRPEEAKKKKHSVLFSVLTFYFTLLRFPDQDAFKIILFSVLFINALHFFIFP